MNKITPPNQQTEYKAIRADNWRALWSQIADHMRTGWEPIGKTDLFDNEWGGADWVQALRKTPETA